MEDLDTRTNTARRDFLALSTGAIALAATAGLGKSETALAQTGANVGAPVGGTAQGKVLVEQLKGGVLMIGINRPEARNLLHPSMILDLGKAVYQFERDDALRVAVLYGRGPDFSLGADGPAIAEARRLGKFPPRDPDFMNPFNFPGSPFPGTASAPLRTKPVVVAVQGGTKLGGHELFLSADVRFAASDTVFSQAEVTRGSYPFGGATVRFVREAGWGNAMRYMLTGEEWGAEEARRMGLVQEITAPGQQLQRAVDCARKIADAAPLGVRATLASAHRAQAEGEIAAYGALGAEAQKLSQSEDFQERLRAARENRPPVYQGR